MLGLAALVLATATASTDVSPGFAAAAPWWEKITFTLADDGAQQSCRYESSLGEAESCDSEPVPAERAPGATPGSYTKITFERRFTPGAEPAPIRLDHGDSFLGGQVLAIAIGSDGSVRSCTLVAQSGDLNPGYGCNEVKAERFEAGSGKANRSLHQGYLTVLVYGHEEQLA